MQDQRNCNRCGKTGLVQGTLQSTGTLHFRPFGVPFLTFRTADVAIRAGICPGCGTVTLQGDIEKLNLIMQTVDGKQSAPALAADR